ncbi:DUF4951 domain-containing protein [Moraxella sp. ZY210820]|uniref:DUF4951 domain-containing protein n=1 Tax=unclassified Moraxella TaxID=2685852 RepID=UPI00272FC533|nr:DUF4951 domain-containing protein [Moraxella sp. ZY210820]WLF84942.1 DUF4951 domain-containing protein [Moraxella sp. ZY210820]
MKPSPLKLLFCCLITTNVSAELHINNIITPLPSQVNKSINRLAIPPIPEKMSLTQFGQEVIQWGTGFQGAKYQLDNITAEYVQTIKQHGITQTMIVQWRDFYQNETQRNPSNIAAYYRALLMQKILTLW